MFTSKSRSGLLAKFVVLNRLELARDLLTQDISVLHVFIHEISKDLVGVFLKTRNYHVSDRFRGQDSILKVQKRNSDFSIWCTWKILLNRYILRSPTPHYATVDSFRAIRWNESLEIHQIVLFSLVFLWLSFFRKLKRINLQTVGYDHTVKEDLFSGATRNISSRQWNQPTTQNPVELLHARTAFLSGQNHTDQLVLRGAEALKWKVLKSWSYEFSESHSTLKHDFSALRVFPGNLDPDGQTNMTKVPCDRISESSLEPLAS